MPRCFVLLPLRITLISSLSTDLCQKSCQIWTRKIPFVVYSYSIKLLTIQVKSGQGKIHSDIVHCFIYLKLFEISWLLLFSSKSKIWKIVNELFKIISTRASRNDENETGRNIRFYLHFISKMCCLTKLLWTVFLSMYISQTYRCFILIYTLVMLI